MMFDDIKEETTRDFLELRNWVLRIPDRTKDEDFFVISRGLFFVYAYGLYEKIIQKIVFQTITMLNEAKIPICECVYELYSLGFSKEYDGIENVGREYKWKKRWEISKKLSTKNLLNIPSGTFPTDGKNIRYKQLDSIAKSFGMRRNVIPENNLIGFLEELVDNRNHIAHGDQTPKEVGRNYTKSDLLKRCNVISEICSYTIEIYEQYIIDREYMR